MHSAGTFFRWVLTLGAVVVTATVASAQTPLLLVAIGHEKTVVLIDPASGKIVGRAPIDDDAHDVVASEDGKLAFTANGTPGTISVVDLASRKELRRVNIGRQSHPSRLAFRGGRLYFTVGPYKMIGRYDPASNQIDWLVGTGQDGTNIVAVTKDGDKIFASNRESNSVSAIEGVLAGPPKWTVTNVPIGASLEGLDVSPDGREVWAAKRFGAGIAIIDVATKKVSHLDVPLGKPDKQTPATRLSFTPDGRRVLMLDRPSQQVVVLDAVARKEINRFTVRGASLLVAPDSSRAYVSVEQSPTLGNGYVQVIDLNKLELAGRIQVPPGPPVPCSGHCDTMALAWAGK